MGRNALLLLSGSGNQRLSQRVLLHTQREFELRDWVWNGFELMRGFKGAHESGVRMLDGGKMACG